MANRITIATFSLEQPAAPAGLKQEVHAAACLERWREQFEALRGTSPDLVVLPECATRPECPERTDPAWLLDYYEGMGDRLIDLCREQAVALQATFVCSQVRRLPDGRRCNCSTVIGPGGDELGVYCKNHLVIEEHTRNGLAYGGSAELIRTPFGSIACVICFDLNFDALRLRYASLKPDLLVFSSMFHGGMLQELWAYSCRCHFVGAMGRARVPGEIRDPFGRVLHSTSNYNTRVTGSVNLDCVLAHLDYNEDKLARLQQALGQEVTLLDPGRIGSVLITSESPTRSARDLAADFGIELLDDYLPRADRARDAFFAKQPRNRRKP